MFRLIIVRMKSGDDSNHTKANKLVNFMKLLLVFLFFRFVAVYVLNYAFKLAALGGFSIVEFKSNITNQPGIKNDNFTEI